MIAKLRALLANMSQEEFDRDWAAIKAMGLEGPTVKEFIASFRQPAVYQYAETEVFQDDNAQRHLNFEVEAGDELYTLAA